MTSAAKTCEPAYNGRGTAEIAICQTEGLRKEDAELLVYLVNEEMDIYIGVLVVVCHLGPVGRILSATSVLSPWSIEQEKRQKEGAKDFTVHPDVRRTPEKGLRAVSWPTAVPISADTIPGIS
jgi:hypothetical protein